MFCFVVNTIWSTKSVQPKHKAQKLQKLKNPKMEPLQIANIKQKMQEWKMLKSLTFFYTLNF
jgi:hypothetical protein